MTGSYLYRLEVMQSTVKALPVTDLETAQRVQVGPVAFTVRKETPSADVADVPDVFQIELTFPDEQTERISFPSGGYVSIDSMALSLTEHRRPMAGVLWMAKDPGRLFLFATHR